MVDKFSVDTSKIFRKKLLIDTNLLILFMVGSFDKGKIRSFPLLQKYTVDDYELLLNFINMFRFIVTTPHILTELSNLSKKDVHDPLRDTFFKFLSSGLLRLLEISEPFSNYIDCEEFSRIGLTDTFIKYISETNDFYVLTDDLELVNLLWSRNIEATNFNNIRYLIQV